MTTFRVGHDESGCTLLYDSGTDELMYKIEEYKPQPKEDRVAINKPSSPSSEQQQPSIDLYDKLEKQLKIINWKFLIKLPGRSPIKKNIIPLDEQRRSLQVNLVRFDENRVVVGDVPKDVVEEDNGSSTDDNQEKEKDDVPQTLTKFQNLIQLISILIEPLDHDVIRFSLDHGVRNHNTVEENYVKRRGCAVAAPKALLEVDNAPSPPSHRSPPSPPTPSHSPSSSALVPARSSSSGGETEKRRLSSRARYRRINGIPSDDDEVFDSSSSSSEGEQQTPKRKRKKRRRESSVSIYKRLNNLESESSLSDLTESESDSDDDNSPKKPASPVKQATRRRRPPKNPRTSTPRDAPPAKRPRGRPRKNQASSYERCANSPELSRVNGGNSDSERSLVLLSYDSDSTVTTELDMDEPWSYSAGRKKKKTNGKTSKRAMKRMRYTWIKDTKKRSMLMNRH